MIKKGDKTIATLTEWQKYGGPKHASQWVPERSAFEAAREWLGVRAPALPEGIAAALRTNNAFGTVTRWTAEPEVQLRFDSLRGEPRNTDLLIDAEDEHGPFLIAVEAKADESFGDTVLDTFSAALERRIANPRSKGVDRIVALAESLFGPRPAGSAAAVGELRYQLLTSLAGAIAASRGRGNCRVVLLVEEFVTGKTSEKRHVRNSEELNAFVHRLTQGRIGVCESGVIHGPIDLKRKPLFDLVPPVFIGKVRHDRREVAAHEAVIVAMRALGGERTVQEVKAWIEAHLTERWEDIGTTMADMAPSSTSTTGLSPKRQVLDRVAVGTYHLSDRWMVG